MKRIILAALLTLGCATTAFADDVDSANKLCALLDQTGLTSQKCAYSVWNSEVTTVIDMTPSEARDLCQKIAGSVKSLGAEFQRAWTLQIRSPYSGNNSIAFCNI